LVTGADHLNLTLVQRETGSGKRRNQISRIGYARGSVDRPAIGVHRLERNRAGGWYRSSTANI
jgi:hypothetical protein